MSTKKRLLLVGWDSADWKLMHPLIDEGKLPGVQRLVEGGVSGNLTTLEPQLSPMLWTSIATGKMAYHHGVQGFTEVDPVSGQVVPVSAATRQCKALWEMLGERGLKSHVIGWFATQGERDLNGCMVSNMFGHLTGIKPDQDPADWPPPMPGTYWPEELAEKLNTFRISPHEIDPDQVLRLFVPDAPKVDQQRDRYLWSLLEKLAEAYSVQSAATWLMEMEPDWDFMAVYFRALDEIKHDFMHYHPPRMSGIPERDFEMYKEVVTSTYRAHDMMLERLIHLAGPDAAVVLISDHGFHSDHLRPKFTPRTPAGITVWHRQQGVIAACGPGFKKDELVYGARLLDLAPTVLHYFDLPVGEDMEGRVLSETLDDGRKVQTIPTWEDPDGKPPVRHSLSEKESKTLLEQFVALGYIDEVSADPTKAAAETIRENKWNLARACLYGGKDEMALPLLEDCYAAYPERPDYAQKLAQCQLRLGLLDEAEATVEVALESFGRTEGARLLRACIAVEKRDYREALEQLEVVRQRTPDEPQMLAPLARAYLELRRWDDAESAAHKILEQDPNNPQACLILARSQLHRGNSERAAESALDAIAFQYGNPRGHFLLGAALVQQGDWANARTALTNSIRLEPQLLPAYRYLSATLRMLDLREEALQYELLAHKMRQEGSEESRQRTDRLRGEMRERTATRNEERRRQREEQARHAEEETAVAAMDFVLVSGLPRSGTSLMMQMLQAGGMDLMADQKREADEDNPEGYWEWEDIKKLSRNPRLLEQAEGKVVKIISALLPHLPPKHRYKIVFMRRPESEVVRSQWKMLEHRNVAPKSEADHLAETQASHVRQILERLHGSERVEVLEVDYPSLVSDPKEWTERLCTFIGTQALPTAERMPDVVRPDLYRNRQEPVGEPES